MQADHPPSFITNDDHNPPSSKYDPNVIRQAAEEKFQNQDIAGAQMVYASALLDWVDDAREGVAGDGMDPEQLREAIATLWLSYAQLHQRAKQYKSATDAYEGAVTCPVAGSVGRVWLEYARFAEERDKIRTAQKVYLRALVGVDGKDAAVADRQDRNLLWQEFLDMMRRAQSNPNLTMKELKEAAEQEHARGSGTVSPSQTVDAPDRVTSLFAVTADDTVDRPEKRQKMEESPMVPPAASGAQDKTHVVTTEAIEAEANELMQASMPPEISAAWYVRDGDAPPNFPDQLFSPSPPKLSDPTGKELFGNKLALALMERLLKRDEQDTSGSVLLDVCRGCWMLTALKEKEASRTIALLDATMMSEMETMEGNLETRLSVAGAAASAIEQMNENERSSFQQSCYQRRQQLLTSLAWEFRQILCLQQQLLTKARVPGFEGPSADATVLELHTRICSYLHSAFFLRQRIGESAHNKMLQSQIERLRREVESSPPITSQPPPPHSDAALPPPPPDSAYADGSTLYGYPLPPPQQGHNPPAGYPGMVQQPPPLYMMPPPQGAMPEQAFGGQAQPPQAYYPPRSSS